MKTVKAQSVKTGRHYLIRYPAIGTKLTKREILTHRWDVVLTFEEAERIGRSISELTGQIRDEIQNKYLKDAEKRIHLSFDQLNKGRLSQRCYVFRKI